MLNARGQSTAVLQQTAARRQTAPPHHTHNFCWRGPRQRSHGEGNRYFVCAICTSNSSSADVASLSLPLSVSLFKSTLHNSIAISLPALLSFRSYNEVFVQTAFIPYYLSTDMDFL